MDARAMNYAAYCIQELFYTCRGRAPAQPQFTGGPAWKAVNPQCRYKEFALSKLGEESAYQAAKSWLRLATSRAELFDLVAGQTHELALGARKAFDELKDCAQRETLASAAVCWRRPCKAGRSPW